MIAATGLAGVGMLSGCALFDPTVGKPTGAPNPGTSPSPTELPFQAQGLSALAQVEAHALGIQANATSLKLTTSQTGLLAWLVQSLQIQRAAVIRGTPVTDAETSPQPVPSVAAAAGTTWASLLSEVPASSKDHLARAAGSRGLDSLLWASIAAFAATAVTSPSGAQARSLVNAPAQPKVPSEQDALSEVIAGTHALCYATELALVPVPGSDPAYARINNAWTSWLQTRDDLSQSLRALGGTPPGSKAPYDVSAPSTVARALGLVAELETRFLPTVGVWLAAADSTHSAAVALLAKTATQAAGFGGELQVWPGWPTP